MMGDAVFCGTFSYSRAFAMSTVPILIAEDDHKSIVIDRPAIVVGRSRRRADVCIDDRSISAVHCEIAVRENCLQVRNRGLNGIRINGRKSAEGVLQDGDILEIARLKYRVLMAGDSGHPNALQSSRSNDWLVRLAGMELGPMPWAELSLMVQRGELTRTDEVRWSEQPHWIPAATADGLFDAVAVAAKSAAPMNGKVAKLTKSGNSQADHSTVPAETSAEPGNGSGNESRPLEFGSSDNLQISFKASVDSLIDTATNLPDETDASARALKPGLSISRDGKSRKANSQHDKPQIDDDLGWSLDDGLEEEFADPGGHNAAIASGNPAGLPPLPLPPPLPIATQPIPLPAAHRCHDLVH
jgi:predicted component of type VI protein secretion system